jgi:hypothetical protein
VVIVEKAPRAPGINPDGSITLLHGTTALNAAGIREHGFRPMDPKRVATEVADLYGVPPHEVFENIHFEFPRHRRDLDRAFFTSDPETAAAYTIPEAFQDALRAVAYVKGIGRSADEEDDARRATQARSDWVTREGRRLFSPEVLAVTMPWRAVGDHAFGKKMSLKEWRDITKPALGELFGLHSISIPIHALGDIRVAPARRL